MTETSSARNRGSSKTRARGTGGVFQKGSIWYIHYSHNGHLCRESSHSPHRSDAENLLKKRLGELGF